MITLAMCFNILCAGFIVYRSLDALNRMSKTTLHRIRIAHWTAFVGGLAVVLGPLYGYVRPPEAELILNVAFALHLWFDRRTPKENGEAA